MKPFADNVILIGMPAVGKSTLGVLLAKRLGFGFIDTDLLIQIGENKQLQDIIQAIGVESFCDLEERYILGLSASRTVIATGGSVVYRGGGMAHLKNLGRVCFLEIDLPDLQARLGNLDRRGVVRVPGQTIEMLYAQRQPLYRQYAQMTVQCSGLTHEQAVLKLLKALQAVDTSILFSSIPQV
jgi:shikimate kinase